MAHLVQVAGDSKSRERDYGCLFQRPSHGAVPGFYGKDTIVEFAHKRGDGRNRYRAIGDRVLRADEETIAGAHANLGKAKE